mmetsp:Transcript_32942/g.51586  ORF Transcript_32942/g.51586 Transcript_32942/m.51586 type:complete len:89 (+) Transcript_32942:221-487(+)
MVRPYQSYQRSCYAEEQEVELLQEKICILRDQLVEDNKMPENLDKAVKNFMDNKAAVTGAAGVQPQQQQQQRKQQILQEETNDSSIVI